MSAGKRTSGRTWAYVAAVLGGAVSVAANVAHSLIPAVVHAGAVALSVFWPVALFVAIEVLARTPWPLKGQDTRRWGVLVRWVGLPPVALVAAVVSYRHLSGLLAFYGEDALTVAIGPLAVDGLMIMAAGALIVTGHGRATADAPAATADTGHVLYRPAGLRLNDGPGRVEAIVSPARDMGQDVSSVDVQSESQLDTAPDMGQDTGQDMSPVDVPSDKPGVPLESQLDTTSDMGQDTDRTGDTPYVQSESQLDTAPDTGDTADVPSASTAALVSALARQFPDMPRREAATRLGVSTKTIGRHWPTPARRINGHAPTLTEGLTP